MAYSSINKPSLHFNTVLYTGDATSNRGITGVGFQPDLVWNKSKSSNNHYIFDAIRSAGQRISTNTTSAEDDKSAEFISFDSDGFTLTNNAGSLNINGSGVTFANWCWKADNTSGSSNTDGSITSTVAANTTAGFSIVTFTGTGSNATVGHGLGAAPKCMWLKGRSGATQWNIYNASSGANKHLNFDSTEVEQSYTNRFNDTDPTSTVFTVGTDAETNPSSGTMVAYCFAEVKGFSKFGGYTANNSSDGPFLYCGFRPAMVIIKNRSRAGESWSLYDNKRDGYNPNNNRLYPNATTAEGAETKIDFLSSSERSAEALSIS